jgi:predicted transcriptional regulator
MELHFTAEQEAQLSQVAFREGKPIEQLLTESAVLVLREHDRFLAAVEEGIQAAERGEFVEEEQMDARVAEMLRF